MSNSVYMFVVVLKRFQVFVTPSTGAFDIKGGGGSAVGLWLCILFMPSYQSESILVMRQSI